MPELQIAFARCLETIRSQCLQEALLATVGALSVSDLDRELSSYVSEADLALLASKGLRGEVLFSTPLLLTTQPRLLGYYRLLLGYSQKAFYLAETGLAGFKPLEDRGVVPARVADELPSLCRALNDSASFLLNGIPSAPVSARFAHELTLLTLGPQLRGGQNVIRGVLCTKQVFDVIRKTVRSHIAGESHRCIEVRNAAGREVRIEFASDPDIVIRERMGGNVFRNVIAIEVKGGTDYSNVHNRIGEAEKSHQKAKADGFVECWTVVNVSRLDAALAKTESPSTNRFYSLRKLLTRGSPESKDFRARMLSLTGVPDRARSPR